MSQGRIEEAEKTLMKIWVQNSSTCPSVGFTTSSNRPAHRHGDAKPVDDCIIQDSHSPISEESSRLLHIHSPHHVGDEGDRRTKSPNPPVVRSINLKAMQKKNSQSGIGDIIRNSKLFAMTVINVLTWWAMDDYLLNAMDFYFSTFFYV